MPILINNQLVEANDGYGRTVRQLIELYLKPNNVEFFNAALIEFWDQSNKEPELHLDEDVKLIIGFKKPSIPPETVGETISLDLQNISELSWADEGLSGDSGKVLIIRWTKDLWVLHFDFTYNREYIKRRALRAKEFLQTVKKLDPVLDLPTIVYLLWSVGELIVDAKLGSLHGMRPGISHNDRKEKEAIIRAESDQETMDFFECFNLLRSEKNHARYAEDLISSSINALFMEKAIKIFSEVVEYFVV